MIVYSVIKYYQIVDGLEQNDGYELIEDPKLRIIRNNSEFSNPLINYGKISIDGADEFISFQRESGEAEMLRFDQFYEE